MKRYFALFVKGLVVWSSVDKGGPPDSGGVVRSGVGKEISSMTEVAGKYYWGRGDETGGVSMIAGGSSVIGVLEGIDYLTILLIRS